MKAKFASLFLLFAILVSTADAQANQRRRIRQGVRSGELTKAETVNLRKGQKDIRQDKRQARADGVVTPTERKEIRQEKRQESRKIYRKKHNGRTRN